MGKTKIILDCPLPGWLAMALVAAALATALVFLHKDARHLALRRRGIILVLMGLGTLMVGGVLLGPKLIRTWPDPRKPLCAVLADGSRSMLFADAYEGPAARWLGGRLGSADSQPQKVPRLSVLQAVLSPAAEGWLTRVRKDFDLAGWRFAGEVEPLALEASAPLPMGIPEDSGYSTALGEALEACARGVGGQRPRAVVLVSDGAWNAGRDPTEIARVLGRLGCPVYAVGVGDPSPPRDVAVLDLQAPKEALLGDELALAAKIAATGLEAARVPVQLFADGELLAEKQVLLLPGGRPTTVTFSHVPTQPGPRQFKVVVPRQEGEQDEANNAASARVQVIERKIRILLVEGNPRWEFRFIRNVFERDPAVELRICLTRPGVGPIVGGEYLDKLPADKKALADYDLVILGDVPREALPDTFLTELADLVRFRGGALLVQAGRSGEYRRLAGSPVEKILPVRLEGAGEPATPSPTGFPVELTQEGASHLVTRLAEGTDPAENEECWSALPAVHWAASVAALAPGASALAVHPYQLAGASKLPLIALHRVGAGKVVFLGIDETWRWRKTVGDQYHYRFWAQMVRWMTRKQFSEGDPRGRLSADRAECGVGEKVQIEAYCLGPDGFPLENAQVALRIEQPGGQVLQLSMRPAEGGWGLYQADFTPTRSGTHRAGLLVSIYGDQPLSSTLNLEVTRLDLEKNALAQDRATLAAIAQASGGQYLELERVDELPSLLAATLERRNLTAEYSPCRNGVYYAVLTVILAGAWLIRKRSGLA